MINLDPSIIDQESVRKKRRKKLLRISFLPVLILLLAGLFFLRQGVFDILFGIVYNNEDAGIAIALSQMQKNGNVIEPYIAYYDAGTAYLKDGDGEKAEADLKESLKNMPPTDKICQVRVNLSYSIEIQADEAKIMQQYDRALTLYSRAEGVLLADNCANKNKNGKDAKAEAAQKRISQKRSNTVAKMNNSGDDGTINEKGGLEISEEQLEKLQKNTKNGSIIRDEVLRRNSSSGSGGGGSYGSYTYHW